MLLVLLLLYYYYYFYLYYYYVSLPIALRLNFLIESSTEEKFLRGRACLD